MDLLVDHSDLRCRHSHCNCFRQTICAEEILPGTVATYRFHWIIPFCRFLNSGSRPNPASTHGLSMAGLPHLVTTLFRVNRIDMLRRFRAPFRTTRSHTYLEIRPIMYAWLFCSSIARPHLVVHAVLPAGIL